MAHWGSKTISSAYSTFRPTYPAELFDVILSKVPTTQRGKCIDIGCGTGQALAGLAPHFTQCIGVDPSKTQLDHAQQFENVKYVEGAAESFTIPEQVGSWHRQVDLITVAQALHWFEMKPFLAHVDSLLAPGGVLAVWMYGSAKLQPKECHELWDSFDGLMLRANYWPSGRKHIDDSYATLTPQVEKRFTRIGRDVIAPWRDVSVERFVSYMGTMSGVGNYMKLTQHVTALEDFSRRFVDAVTGDYEADPSKTMMKIKHDFILFTFQKGASPKL